MDLTLGKPFRKITVNEYSHSRDLVKRSKTVQGELLNVKNGRFGAFYVCGWRFEESEFFQFGRASACYLLGFSNKIDPGNWKIRIFAKSITKSSKFTSILGR